MAWTSEQQRAISEEGKNILVSAGAGSGKTAVLTARVKRILLSGVHVNQLLVLTFTNAAAHEMKERIRKTILETPTLSGETALLEEAFITTFDSFALSLVKKYHTRLNITNQIQICDEVLIEMQKRKLLNEILDERYLSPKQNFQRLIHDFCLKDDNELIQYFLNVYQKIELKQDKTEYLNNYFSFEMTDTKTKSLVQEYLQLLFDKQKLLREAIDSLEDYFDGDFVLIVQNNFRLLLDASSYDDFVKGLDYKSIVVPRGSDEAAKKLKQKVFDIASSMKEYCYYTSEEEMIDEYFSTKESMEAFVEILRELDKRLMIYKRNHDLYTFTDISRMAIQLVQNEEDIRSELQDQFYEILVDEYQDTSDTQELFLSYITHDNLYMVGDIKQSIYRFRNANPYIFKEKYDLYQNGQGGEKIDLLKNFRSRREVLENVNLLFDFVMDDSLGGARYVESHRMIFGNDSYEKEGATSQNYQMELLTYDRDHLGRVSFAETEAFMIGEDILHKMKEPFMVFDKDKKILRPIEYKDFVILLDRSRDFDLYKKVFEYLHIPLSVLKDESLKKNDDIYMIRNLFRFLICLKEKRYDEEFRYCFLSVSRSFLFSTKDSDLYEMFVDNRFLDSSLCLRAFEIIPFMDTMNPSQFLLLVMNHFLYDEKLITIGNVQSCQVRIEYLYQMCLQYEKQGKTIYDFVSYLNELLEEDYDLRFHALTDSSNSCQIMTIHKSKGLEFPICYFSSLSSRFNLNELKEKIVFDSHYGIIMPKVEESYKDTFVKKLLKNRTRKEEISERIRLFYVAVTRAKEKMVFVLPKQDEGQEVLGIVPYDERESYHSFLDILKSIYSLLLPFVQERNVSATKDYLNMSQNDFSFSSDCTISVNEVSIEKEKMEQKHFSKDQKDDLSESEKDFMKMGILIHQILEEIDFFNYHLDDYDLDSFWKSKILSFLNSSFIQKYQNGNFYKEYEFLWDKDGVEYHGIMDLVIELDDEIVIVDYKLKDVLEEEYQNQLNGYRSYLERKTGKPVRCYLYSILEEKFLEVIHD